jgi:uncharacterized small protein (DUF1192 family)
MEEVGDSVRQQAQDELQVPAVAELSSRGAVLRHEAPLFASGSGAPRHKRASRHHATLSGDSGADRERSIRARHTAVASQPPSHDLAIGGVVRLPAAQPAGCGDPGVDRRCVRVARRDPRARAWQDARGRCPRPDWRHGASARPSHALATGAPRRAIQVGRRPATSAPDPAADAALAGQPRGRNVAGATRSP